ncbi:MAG: ADP-ribosylation factor-like protein [Promethearchaeota archaeon]
MTESSKIGKVILLAGLDNSGKTSIAYSLRGTRNLPTFCKARPTVRRNIISIKAYDSEFIVWDLGGQEAYRDEYLANYDNYFKGLDKLIYVFDVQDVNRYDLALDYYEKIIILLKDRNDISNIEVSIFLHKYDPDLSNFKPDITDKIIDDLKEKIKEIIDNTGFFYQIFKTSIYCLFDKTVTD